MQVTLSGCRIFFLSQLYLLAELLLLLLLELLLLTCVVVQWEMGLELDHRQSMDLTTQTDLTRSSSLAQG